MIVISRTEVNNYWKNILSVLFISSITFLIFINYQAVSIALVIRIVQIRELSSDSQIFDSIRKKVIIVSFAL